MRQHECIYFWSAFASGGKPQCVECSPPPKGTKVRKQGVLVNGRVWNQSDFTRQIAASNLEGEYADLLQSLGPEFERCPPPEADRVVPGRLHQKRLLVGARYTPKVSTPPADEIVMPENSPFWHERSLEVSSRSDYTIRARKSSPKPANAKEANDVAPEDALRKRRGKRRS